MKIKNINEYRHLFKGPKTQNASQLKWILDLRTAQLEKSKISGSSGLHDTLHTKDKKVNKTCMDFNVGDLREVRHVLNSSD